MNSLQFMCSLNRTKANRLAIITDSLNLRHTAHFAPDKLVILLYDHHQGVLLHNVYYILTTRVVVLALFTTIAVSKMFTAMLST